MKSKTKFKFRLYVASNTSNAAKATANLQQFCRVHLAGRHAIEVVDVFKNPQRALDDQIYMTPLLLRLAPKPLCRVVGTLDQTQPLLAALGVRSATEMDAA